MHDANAKYIVDHGGCLLIIQAMRQHMNTVDFKIQALHAIASLGKYGKLIIDRENFFGVVLRCLKNNIEDVDLVSGMSCLIVAAWHSVGTLANSGVKIVQYKSELIALIFESMRRFQSNCTFLITACFALAHAFFNHRIFLIRVGDSNTDDSDVANQGGIECILDILRQYPNQESLQTTALFALGSIVTRSGIYSII